ncbi:hypothetical protein L9F63_024238, partial [Diploptera punctata]
RKPNGKQGTRLIYLQAELSVILLYTKEIGYFNTSQHSTDLFAKTGFPSKHLTVPLQRQGAFQETGGVPKLQAWIFSRSVRVLHVRFKGITDNLNYGVHFAQRFVDAPEREKPPEGKSRKSWAMRMKMNLHNNEAGRQVVSGLMKMQCRCHGISGSCEVKTCWRTLPSFNEIGDTLKRKYREAVQVTPKSRKHQRRNGKLKLKPKSKRWQGAVKKGELIHIHKSPNYCVNDPQKGIPGTSGRVCNKTSHGPDSCDLLCCGRGYNTQVIKHVERCQCKFVWCCSVKCKNCETLIDRHTCK